MNGFLRQEIRQLVITYLQIANVLYCPDVFCHIIEHNQTQHDARKKNNPFFDKRKVKRQSLLLNDMYLCACLSQQRRHFQKIRSICLTHADILFLFDFPQINLMHSAHIKKAFHIVPVNPDHQKTFDKAYPSILQASHLKFPLSPLPP